MAEMLTVVAIIVILAGVAFIALWNHQRSLAQLERDNIAKEIFIAAQNHLTMAKGEGYLLNPKDDITNEEVIFGYKDDADSSRYIVVNNGVADSNKGAAMLNLMLPFGSIDETVRVGGSYIIRYEKESGTVLDVFYCSADGTRYGHSFSAAECASPDSPFKLKDIEEQGTKGEPGYVEAQDHKSDRRDWNGAVLGWYGGEDAGQYSNIMHQPTVKVINTSKLIVLVQDDNKIPGASAIEGKAMRLIITGEQSGAGKYYDLTWPDPDSTNKVIQYETKTIQENAFKTKVVGRHYVVLDDITTPNLRFANQFADSATTTDDKAFIPGENLIIKAVAYNNSVPSNIEYSNEVVTNSLFGSASPDKNAAEEDEDQLVTATISNLRHLENLDESVSGFKSDKDGKVWIHSVDQTDNIYWNGREREGVKSFISELKRYDPAVTGASIYSYDNTTNGSSYVTEEGSIKPIAINTKKLDLLEGFTYNGHNHSIAEINITENYETDLAGAKTESTNSLKYPYAGLFEQYEGGTIENVELANFKVKGSAYAGALAGILYNTTVSNVLVRNTVTDSVTIHKDADFNNNDSNPNTNIESDVSVKLETGGTVPGVAGGLVGAIMDRGTLQYSASSLYVKGGISGGLVGQILNGATLNGTTVTGCYSGGHTEHGEYYKHTENDGKIQKTPLYNVRGTTAGGLIGDAGDATISSSYSTCSVYGDTTVGGFVGRASGAISKCYCTGLVGLYAEEYADSKTDQTQKDNAKRELKDEKTGYDNAFIGSSDNNIGEGNCYLSIVNEYSIGSDVNYKTPGNDNVKAADENTTNFGKFSGSYASEGIPYDRTVNYNGIELKGLNTYHNNKYVYKTIDQLIDGGLPDKYSESNTDGIKYYVDGRHYGDWPAPEIFIINQ